MSVVGLFVLAAILACAVSLMRGGRTYKLGLTLLFGPVVILVGTALAIRRERRLLYIGPNGYRRTGLATLLMPTLDLLPSGPLQPPTQAPREPARRTSRRARLARPRVGVMAGAYPVNAVLRLPPLTGRDEELALVKSLLASEDTSGVMLAGSSGVGKTRLAQEAVRHAETPAGAAVWVTATRAAQALPFGAMLHLVAPEDLDPGASPLSLYRKVREALEARDSTVIVVDDAHLLDDVGAELVSYLARTSSLRFVLTARSGELIPDPITRLWRDDQVIRIDLQALAHHEVRALVAGVLTGRVEESTVDHLFALTEGNPLFLRELIIDGLTSGSLKQHTGTWVWRRQGELSSRLADVVLDRLGHLEEPVWGVLNVLAIGEPLAVNDLVTVSPFVSGAGIDAAERAGCVIIATNGSEREVHLAHPLFGELARARMSRGLADSIRGSLATRIASSGTNRPGDLLRRALWTLESGLPSDADLFLAAATQARAFDGRLELRFAKAAADANPCFDTKHALAWSERDLEQRERLAQEVDDLARVDHEVARAADLLAHQRLNRSLDFAGAAYALEDAARRVRDPGTQSGLHARRVQVLLHAGQTSDAIDVAREVLASPAAPPGARLRAAQQASMALGLCGQETSAAEIWAAEYELALSVASSEPIVAVELLAARGICGLVAGRLVEVEAALADLHESAASNVFAHGWELLLRGRMALFRGDGGLAIASLGDAMIAHQEHPNGALLLYAKSLASEAHAMVGDVTSASAIVRTLGSTADMDHGPSTSDAKRALGWVPVANGETTAGSDMFIAAADRARSGGFRVPEMLALYDAIRVGERGAAMDRLLSVARACEGPLPSAVAAHVEALRRDRGKDLEAVSMAFEDNRMAVLAAEAASQAARAFARGGLRRREAEANARVDRLRHACREMRTPVLDAAMTPVSLTRREREVTRLAVQGLSSRVIAERLGVNVRTVDGHLYQVYGKLGVNGRAALARVWKTTEQNR